MTTNTLASVSATLLLALATWGCSNGSTATTTSPSASATSPTTESFASEVGVGGSASQSFKMTTSGTVKVTLASLGDGSQRAGLGIGVGGAGAPCSLAQSVVTGSAGTPQIVTSADAGTYCVQVFDAGTLTADTPFSLSVEHP